MQGANVKQPLSPARSSAINLSPEQLSAAQKYGRVLQEAYFAFSDSDGDADKALERLFSLTPEVLGAPDSSGRSPVGAAVASGTWNAANHLISLAEAAQNSLAFRRQTTDTSEDALALAIGAEPPADAAVLRRLVRHRALHCGCSCCCRCREPANQQSDCCRLGVDRRGRNALHSAAAAAAAGRPRDLELVLDELDSVLDQLERKQQQQGAPTDSFIADGPSRPAEQLGPPRDPNEEEAKQETLDLQLNQLRRSLTEALNAPDAEGWTPVHWMARAGGSAALHKLLELAQRHRLEPDWEARQAGGRGLSPLAVAAEAGEVEACQLLLSRGLAQVDLDDDLWLRAAPAPTVGALLSRHSRRLLEPLAETPPDALRRLAAGLIAAGDEVLNSLRAGLQESLGLTPTTADADLLEPPRDRGPAEVAAWLAGLDGSCGSSARLAVWRLLRRLGRSSLASLLEAE